MGPDAMDEPYEVIWLTPEERYHRERAAVIARAELEIERAIHEIERRHGLKVLEELFILNHISETKIRLLGALNGMAGVELKSALRRERHPDDPSKPADEA